MVAPHRGREGQLAGLRLSEAARAFLLRMAESHAQSAEMQARRRDPAHALRNGLDSYSRWNWMAPTIDIMGRISPDLGAWTLDGYRRALDRAPLSDREKRNARHPLPPECV